MRGLTPSQRWAEKDRKKRRDGTNALSAQFLAAVSCASRNFAWHACFLNAFLTLSVHACFDVFPCFTSKVIRSVVSSQSKMDASHRRRTSSGQGSVFGLCCRGRTGDTWRKFFLPYVYFGTFCGSKDESAVKRQKAFPPLPLTTEWTEKRTAPRGGAF